MVVGLGACRLFCGLFFELCVVGTPKGTGKKLTGNITHLMIIEHGFAPFVTRHICHWVLLPSIVHVGYTACEGKADACVVIVAY